MRKSKFSESQIVGILGEGESGLPVAEICRKHGTATPPITNGKANIQVFLPANSNASRTLELRTSSSSGCMRSWR